MDLGYVPAVAVAAAALGGAFAFGVAVRSWWMAVLPFGAPLWLAGIGVLGLLLEDRADCYEECGYHWAFFLAVVALAPAAALAVALAFGALVGRRRGRRRRTAPPNPRSP